MSSKDIPQWFQEKLARQKVDREMHFLGFAQLLLGELIQTQALMDAYEYPEQGFPEVKQIIARRAYDLALHCFTSVPSSKQDEYGDPPDCVEHVPDLTQWP